MTDENDQQVDTPEPDAENITSWSKDDDGIQEMQIKAPHIVAATVTVIYSSGDGDTMHVAAKDDKGLHIKIDNYVGPQR